MVIGAGNRATSRTFPQVPEPELAKRGRRQHLLEKAIATKEAARQRREAAELRELQAREEQQRERRDARRAVVRRLFAPAIAVAAGLKRGWAASGSAGARALLAVGAATVQSLKLVRSAWLRAINLIKSVLGAISIGIRAIGSDIAALVKAILAVPGRVSRSIRAAFARASDAARQFAGDFRDGLWATLRYLRVSGPVKLLRGLTWGMVGLFAGIGFIVVVAVHRSRNALADAFDAAGEWMRETLNVRRAAIYGYSAVVGLALVAVAGNLIVGGGSLILTNDHMVSDQALVLSIPAEEPDTVMLASRLPAEDHNAVGGGAAKAVMALDLPLLKVTPAPAKSEVPKPKPEITRSAIAIPKTGVSPTLGDAATQRDPQPSVVPARARIAVVIDDMGMVKRMLPKFAALEGRLTFAFLPYSADLEKQTRVIRERGHQLLVHMPMEPKAKAMDPGPNALLTGLSPDELARRIAWNLDRFGGYVGINNHMGSRFTENRTAMRAVISEVKARHLFFFDSMTTAKSVGYGVAGAAGVPRVQRDVFLDNERTLQAVNRQLRRLEALALRQGHAVAIGHPHKATLAALKAWIPTLEKKGIELVVLSDLVERTIPVIQVAQRPSATPGSGSGLQD